MASPKHVVLEEISAWFNYPEAEIDQMLEERRLMEELYEEHYKMLQNYAEKCRLTGRHRGNPQNTQPLRRQASGNSRKEKMWERRNSHTKLPRRKEFKGLSVSVSRVARTELDTFTHVLSGLAPLPAAVAPPPVAVVSPPAARKNAALAAKGTRPAFTARRDSRKKKRFQHLRFGGVQKH